jgi:hypothetical protein
MSRRTLPFAGIAMVCVLGISLRVQAEEPSAPQGKTNSDLITSNQSAAPATPPASVPLEASAGTDNTSQQSDAQLWDDFARHRHSGLVGSAEWLSWTAHRQGLDFASFVNPIWLTPVSVASLDYARDSGLRVGLGYRLHDGWDVGWNYTRFETDDSAAVHDLLHPGLELMSTQSVLDVVNESVSASSNLRLNVHDLEVGRWIEVGESMDMRLFGSFRWANVSQDFDSVYTYRDLAHHLITGTIANSTDMNAFGLRFGVQGDWCLRPNWRLFGRTAGSVLLGSFDTVQQEVDAAQGTLLDFHNSSSHAVPVLEAAAGVSWNRGPWEVSAGYELSTWFNMADADRSSYDLIFDGFFVRLAFTR